VSEVGGAHGASGAPDLYVVNESDGSATEIPSINRDHGDGVHESDRCGFEEGTSVGLARDFAPETDR
jgi:hypothetical protein